MKTEPICPKCERDLREKMEYENTETLHGMYDVVCYCGAVLRFDVQPCFQVINLEIGE